MFQHIILRIIKISIMTSFYVKLRKEGLTVSRAFVLITLQCLMSAVQVAVLGPALLPLCLRDLDVGGGQQSQLQAQLPDVPHAGQAGPGHALRVGGALQDLPLRVSTESDGQTGGLWLHVLQRCEYIFILLNT